MSRVWLLTTTCYGTWLPGDPRGFVGHVREHRPADDGSDVRVMHDIPGTEYDGGMPGLERAARERMAGPPVTLTADHADVLLSQLRETAGHRGWSILAVAIMFNHLHMVVRVPDDPDPRKVLGDFKSWGTRALSKRFGAPASGTWWSESGSKRKLPDEPAVRAAIRYVLERQPNPLVVWSPPVTGDAISDPPLARSVHGGLTPRRSPKSVGGPVRALSLSLGMLAALPALAQETPSAADVQAQLARLTPRATAEERLAVVQWLRARAPSEHSRLAVPELERLVRKDPDAGVREKAVVALAQIARHHKRPCPLALVEAIRDREDLVRWNAGVYVALFKTDVEPGAVGVLVDGTREDRAEVREHCVLHLGIAGGKDPKALAAIDRAKADPVSSVRHNAYCARFRATDDLGEYLAYVIRLREDPDGMKDRHPPGSDAEKAEQSRYNLLQIGTAVGLAEWAERRPDEMAAALLKLLDDRSAVMRRGAASVIGATARKVEIKAFDPLAGTQDGQNLLDQIRPLLLPEDPKTGDPPEPSKVAIRLRALKVEDRLREVQAKDPDEKVRLAAKAALDRLAAVPAKK